MAATGRGLVVVFLLLPILAAADTCLGPVVSPEVYTTNEVVASAETIIIVEFSLTCKNGLENINLYADLNGKTVPATKSTESNSYQVTFNDEHQNLPAGSYLVRFYDEEGYASLRKAQRSGEGVKNVKPLFTIDISHQGVWKGPYVQSEFVAALVSLLVLYLAYNAKTKLTD